MFIYFQSSCESDPCKNGADCVPEYDLNSYRCHCKLGSDCGTNCEHGGIVSSVVLFFQRSYSNTYQKRPDRHFAFQDFFWVCMEI